MLRRSLSIWKPEETIAETIAFCEGTRVGEIIWKIDVEEFNHGFTPLELIRDYLPWLEKARELQAEKGIVFSINPWLSFGHADRGHYPDGAPPGFWWRVSSNGDKITGVACPLSQGWRQWFYEAYRIYASVRPDKLWVEDDFRTFVSTVGPVEIGCFCEAHLRAFSERIGDNMSRDALVERLIAPGRPDPIRALWFDYQGEIMVEICRDLEEVVHGESHDTRLGLMNSWSTDGRWWEDAILALAGSLRPLARPSLSSYSEGRAISLLPDKNDLLKETACLPEGTQICPELENYPYSSYSKSARMTKLELVLSQVLGNQSVTMNIFDFVGTSIASESKMGRMLDEVKPLLDAIARASGSGGKSRGVSIPFSKRYADAVHVRPGQRFEAFAFDGDGWCLPMQGSGMPVVFNGDGKVSAITGQSVRAMSGTDIERMLSSGVLMDGSAAWALYEMGYGSLIGVRPEPVVERPSFICGAERDDWAEDRSGPVYMSLRQLLPSGTVRFHPLSPSAGARAASVFVDPDRTDVMPGLVVFENELKGRVAVYPFDISAGVHVGFMNWDRRRQLQRTVHWLGRGVVDLVVDGGAWMVPARRDYPDFIFIAVLNCDTDDWDNIALTFEYAGGMKDPRIERLSERGVFTEVQSPSAERREPNTLIRLDLAVRALDVAVFRIESGLAALPVTKRGL